MLVFKEKSALRDYLSAQKKANKTIGFVPTMGALHDGHLSLIEFAKNACDIVVVSIFVNPTQFNNQEDLEKYPRTLDNDIQLIEKKTAKNSIVFAPSAQEVYGENVSSSHFNFGPVASFMEGKYRNGHFDGVGTIVKKLFEMVEPDKAFFGEKDFQQLLIIKKLVELTNLPVEVIGCEINREKCGLARSSRNALLSKEDRLESAFIYEILQQAKADFGTKSVIEIEEDIKTAFQQHPVLKLEYFEIANAKTLAPFSSQKEKYRAFIAAYVKNVRLIDNIALN
ncbi:pantoate--beta-alanine ligase [Mesonia ostreae]|uniref:Pantothenate synthetase n=1 Tax=Mesonia ostreae TaxID=861110 RepID=A0ABU2KKN1_9FLAO|nr:pantoate--beta-alanine ligase [Mesonia ostreae]MDT0295292.1 pantoate--beta-alanine ligase [Mesonia ostreae]